MMKDSIISKCIVCRYHVIIHEYPLLQDLEELLQFIVLKSMGKQYPLGDESLLQFCIHKLNRDVVIFAFEADSTQLIKSTMEEKASAMALRLRRRNSHK